MDISECDIDHQLDEYLFPALYGILFIISIPTNAAALYVSCCQVKKKNELGVYLFSLSLADLFYSVPLPLWIDYARKGDDWMFPEYLCKLLAFLRDLNYYTSSGFLTCISVDRYLAVIHPLRFHYLRTRRFALLVTIIVWSSEIALNSWILMEQEVFPEYFNTTNYIKHRFCYDKYPLKQWQANLNISRVCIGYVIPLVIMVFCYKKIYQAVNHNEATEDHDKKKIKQLLLSILITFSLCFTPYHVILLLRGILEPEKCSFAQAIFVPYRIATALASLNCIADPILYCFVSETGRMDIWNIFKRCFSVKQTDAHQSQIIAMTGSSNDRISEVPKPKTFLQGQVHTELISFR